MTSPSVVTTQPADGTGRMRLLHRLLTPYVRRELPAWGRLYRWLGGEQDDRFSDSGFGVVRGKVHGFEMTLDLGNWSERLTWFLGRYHDLPLQQMLQRVLRPGDRFVDIGANLGMLSLVAAAAVGETGSVLACEPNPRMVERLRQTLERNRLQTVELLHTAVSDAPGTAELREFAGHAGWGSLSAQGPDGAAATASYQVACRVGDDLLSADDPQQPLVIKVDVEGHEVPVLRGLRQTLAARLPLVFVEVVDEHQRRAGFSAGELRDELERLGYRGFVLDAQRRWLRHDVTLRPLQAREPHEVDVLFVPPRGALRERVAALLDAGAGGWPDQTG
ncbi:MAG: FkbM family methyltransferase [Planctomycetota bacterium]